MIESQKLGRLLRISWPAGAVVVAHPLLAALIGHRRELDPIFHFLGGVAGAYAFREATLVFRRVIPSVVVDRARLFAIVAVAIAAVLWECAEFAKDQLFGSRIQLGWSDTLSDLALGVIGAGLGTAFSRTLNQTPEPSP